MSSHCLCNTELLQNFLQAFVFAVISEIKSLLMPGENINTISDGVLGMELSNIRQKTVSLKLDAEWPVATDVLRPQSSEIGTFLIHELANAKLRDENASFLKILIYTFWGFLIR